jgi:protein TonB
LPVAPKQASVDENALLRRFADEISRVLGKSVSEHDYPRLARQNGWQGTAEVRLQIGADGKIKDVLLGRSSGYELLDQRAVELVRRSPLPKVPAAFRAREFSVTVPITFALRNS